MALSARACAGAAAPPKALPFLSPRFAHPPRAPSILEVGQKTRCFQIFPLQATRPHLNSGKRPVFQRPQCSSNANDLFRSIIETEEFLKGASMACSVTSYETSRGRLPGGVGMAKTAAERNAEHRRRLEASGFKPVTIIVPVEDAPFFRDLARAYREGRPIAKPKERLGRKPIAAQIRLAKYWATRAELPLPDYLETHHLSLFGWIGYARTHYSIFSGLARRDAEASQMTEAPEMIFDISGLEE